MIIDPARVILLKEGETKSGPVLYWMSRDQRAENNWALLAAAKEAKAKGTPLIVCFVQAPTFVNAAEAIYSFMLDGLEEIAVQLNRLNIPFVFAQGNPPDVVHEICLQYEVSAVYCDFDPLRIKLQWKYELCKRLKIPLTEVDAHNIVPARFVSTKQEFGAYTIRPKIRKLLNQFLAPFPPIETLWQPATGIQYPNTISVPECQNKLFPAPGAQAAHKQVQCFVNNSLAEYSLKSADPNAGKVSQLSAYLHFGQLSAQETALQIMASGAPHDAKQAFLEQLIVRRELSDNFCLYQPAYDSISAIPLWAKRSLQAHAADEREYTYTYAQFEQAATHDPLWNAAQTEMVTTGYMHGYMRMYWAKKILEWTPDIETALHTAISLNDRYQLDGRDSNGYTGILWSIAGLHDRAWAERPVFGKIRYMNSNGCRRKFDTEQYIDRFRTVLPPL